MYKDKFCIFPWIHSHVLPNGDVLPCCAVKVGSATMGNVHEKPLAEIWNGESYKQMRLDMMSGKAIDSCSVCYLAESSGATSLRHKTFQDFSRLQSLVDKTNADGSLPDFRFYYYDVRFSNLCNLRCRMCCPELSSAVAQDAAKLSGSSLPAPLKVYSEKEAFLKEFRPHVEYLEEVYFAGGEPLLIDAHYWALEELIKSGRRDIRIRYNTNFMVLGKGKWYAPELWKNFDNVEIGASLDASGARAEYIREGTDWEKILKNRETIRTEVPHVDFKIYATVGLLNLLHLPEFLLTSVASKFVLPEKIIVTNLSSPEYLSAIILPEEWKKQARDKYSTAIIKLKLAGTPDWALGNLKAVTTFMDSSSRPELLRDLYRETAKLDSLYGKNFSEVFPEYKGLEDYIQTH